MANTYTESYIKADFVWQVDDIQQQQQKKRRIRDNKKVQF